MPTNTPTAPPVASRLRVSPAVLRRTVTSFAGLMGLTNGADCASTASASPMMGVPSASPQPASAAPAPPPAICATHAELADIAAIHFSAAEGRCEALAGAYCAGLLDTLGASVGVLADAGARALLMARDGEFAEDRAGSSSSSASLPQQCSSNSSGSGSEEEGIAADVHVAFLPNDGQWTARVTVRDAKALRRAAAFVYVSAFINEGRVGGSLVDYANTEGTSRSGSGAGASSGGSELVLSALRQLRRAEASAVAAAAAVRLQRLQDAAAAEKCAGGAAGSRAFAMGRRRAVGLDFLGDDGVGAVGGLFGGVADSAADQQQQSQSPKSFTDATSTLFSTSSPSNNEAARPHQQQRANAMNEAAVAALRKTSVALIAQSTFRCSLAHVPLWASVRRAVEESLLGGLGSSDAEGSSSHCLSVREGAVLALERAWGSAAVGEKKGDENPNYTVQSLRGANGIPFRYTVSCSFDASPATNNAAVGAKRPRATAASSATSALPDFPPPAVDGSVLAVFLCDGETGAMVRESGVGTASSRADATTSGGQQKGGDVASRSDPAAAPETHAAEAPQQPPQPLSLSVVHFMVQDDGRNRVDFVNAML